MVPRHRYVMTGILRWIICSGKVMKDAITSKLYIVHDGDIHSLEWDPQGRELYLENVDGVDVVDPEHYLLKLFSFALRNIISDIPRDSNVGLTIESSTSTIVDRRLYVAWGLRGALTLDVILQTLETF